MRFRFTILVTGLLVLSGCQEQPTPKPPLPARVTAPIEEGPVAPALAQGTAACPPAPACVPAAAKAQPGAARSARQAPAVIRRAAHHVGSSHRSHHGRRPPEPGAHRHYRRYTGPDLDHGARASGEERRHEESWREDSWSSSEAPFDRGRGRAGELQAYGQDGAGMRVAPGTSQEGGFEAAGRDELGYLTWPGKRP